MRLDQFLAVLFSLGHDALRASLLHRFIPDAMILGSVKSRIQSRFDQCNLRWFLVIPFLSYHLLLTWSLAALVSGQAQQIFFVGWALAVSSVGVGLELLEPMVDLTKVEDEDDDDDDDGHDGLAVLQMGSAINQSVPKAQDSNVIRDRGSDPIQYVARLRLRRTHSSELRLMHRIYL